MVINIMKKAGKILWGLGFLSVAALLVAGNFYEIRVSDILLMLSMMILLIEGIIHRNFILIFLPAAGMIILNSERLGIPEINPWSILAAALFGGIGLSVLFPRRGRNWERHGSIPGKNYGIHGTDSAQGVKCGMGEQEFVQTDSKGMVRLENSFGETVKYLTGEISGQVRLKNSFGSMSIHFDNAVMKDHTACVRAESSFGVIVLYVPAAWNVAIKGDTVCGNIRQTGHCSPDGTDTLEIRAEASFGEIKICYI